MKLCYPLTLVKLKAFIEAKTHPGAILGSYRQQRFSNHTEENKLKQYTHPNFSFSWEVKFVFHRRPVWGRQCGDLFRSDPCTWPGFRKNHILSADPVGLPLSRKAESISWLVTRGA